MKWRVRTKPMSHQLAALEASGGRPYFAYFMWPGRGKTKVVIDEVQTIMPDVVVVILPKSIISVWDEEIQTHGLPDTHTVYMWDKKKFKKSEVNTIGPVKWYIINIDAINPVAIKQKHPETGEIMYMRDKKGNILKKKGKPVPVTKVYDQALQALKDIVRDVGAAMVVVDESTLIKNSDSKRTKAVTGLGQEVQYRRILTGTPWEKSPLDVYAQMYFLSKDIFPFSTSYFAFKNKYAIMGGYENRIIVGYKNLEQLASIVAKHSFQVGECPDLPPRTTQVRSVELSDNSWAIYRTLVDEVAVEFGEGVMTIDMAIKKIAKLRQLTGGWIKDDTGAVHQVGAEKVNELKQLVSECDGQKIIIWVQFTHEVLELMKLFSLSKAYHGGMDADERTAARRAFEFGDCPIIIIQNDTGSMGLTLNAATVSIFYTNTASPEKKTQARERNRRKGQTKPVVEYELIVKGSVDEANYNALVNGRSLGAALFAARHDPDAIRKALGGKFCKVNWKAPSKGKPKVEALGPDLGPRPF